jgi:prophage tail gpP-like protein/phage tail protein X
MITTKGDTFESLSRRAYGSESGAAQIRKANPGYTSPFLAGVQVYIPPQIGAPTDRSQRTDGDQVVVIVGGVKFQYWNEILITRSIDAPPAIELSAVWEPSNKQLRDVFRPFSFKPIGIFLGGKKLFSGDMTVATPSTRNDGSTIIASAQGKTAILSDCTPPASAFPLSFDGDTLDTIAAALLSPLGIAVRFEASAGAPFERVELQTGDQVMALIVKLAQQRGLVIGETVDGAALFTKADSVATPVAVLSADAPPVLQIDAKFNPQNYYSHITAIAPTIVGLKGEQVTVKNPYLTNILRPYTFEADDSGNETLQQIAEAKAGRMFANMVSWSVRVATWYKPNGSTWQPGERVKLSGDTAMIYRPTVFLIRSVTLAQNENSRTATLNLVLPGGFAGVIPETLPWEE